MKKPNRKQKGPWYSKQIAATSKLKQYREGNAQDDRLMREAQKLLSEACPRD